MLFHDEMVLGAKARLIAVSLAGGRVEADRGEPQQEDRLPLANTFITLDDGQPAGDARHGIVDLVHRTTLVVEFYDRANKLRTLKAQLAAASEAIMGALLSDLAWAGTFADGRPKIEGVGGVKTVYEVPPEGNYTQGRVQVQIEMLHRSYWQPSTSGLPSLTTVRVDIDHGDDTPHVGGTIAVPQ